MNLDISGKRALVYGSTTGLGRAIAEALINEDAKVAICARNPERLQSVAYEIGASAAIVGDLAKAGEATRICHEACEKLGGIDILVTNTGGPKAGHFIEISSEQWLHDYQSVWMSVVEGLNTLLPKMKEQGFGRVVMVTSIAAIEPMGKLTTSNGLRAGLDGLCKSVAMEYAEFGITLNIVRPGYIDTNRMRELKFTPEYVSKIAAMKRPGKPREVADIVTFLASERASYVTGQSLNIDGGATRSHR